MQKLIRKRTFYAALLALLLVGVLATSVLAAPRVYVNGFEVKFDQPPILENGRLLVPLRAIFESLEAQVNWNDATQTVEAISKHGEKLTLQIGSSTGKLEVDGSYSNISMDVPPKVVNGRTLVPLRVIGESFNKEVSWETKSLSAYINDAKNYAHYVGEAEYNFNKSDWGRAIFWYGKAIEASPNNPDLYYKRAYSQVQTRDFNAALFDLNKAITLSPETADYYSLRATVHEKLGKQKEAAADQQRAGELGD